MATVLVTGGAGYIGSHAVLALQAVGHTPIVLDNLVFGHRELVENVLQAELVVGDMDDRPLLDRLFRDRAIDAVMHFSAFAYVGESVTHPAKYYRNNVAATLTLLEAMVAAQVSRFIFSSTCATYGVPTTVPIPEDHPQNPINPYGRSKWMVEQLLADFGPAYGLQSVCFRYFNAAGADPLGRLGEDHNPETHLIPLLLLTALGHRSHLELYGTDYPTPDGTCIRDYVHVSDLAQAHVLGLEYLLEGHPTTVFNLGNGNGFSVREAIAMAETVTRRSLPIRTSPRRPGDPPILVGSSDRARQVLGWVPAYPNLQDMVAHAWQWHQNRHGLAR
ncbi:MAG TPA: UDP-glucose 4-epimerase GalE [Cyanobacteria bacterium UBA8156]|jgi:UDP-glucose 4-epimerase|nr:UDP-glucose 4-epimerase GalE [Cyanobacteria bacterium UBA8156]